MDYQESDSQKRLSPEAKLWLEDIARLNKYCDSLPDTFAGRWNNGGTLLAVAFTDEERPHIEDLRRLLTVPERVRVVRHRFSRRHLLELRDRIPSILEPTGGLVGWGLNDKDNRVIVTVLPEYLDEVTAILRSTNPDDVRVRLGGPVRPTET